MPGEIAFILDPKYRCPGVASTGHHVLDTGSDLLGMNAMFNHAILHIDDDEGLL